LQPDNSLISI